MTAVYAATMKPLVKYLAESIRFTLDGAPPLRERLAAFLAEQHLMIGDFRALGSGSPDESAFAGVVAAQVPPDDADHHPLNQQTPYQGKEG